MSRKGFKQNKEDLEEIEDNIQQSSKEYVEEVKRFDKKIINNSKSDKMIVFKRLSNNSFKVVNENSDEHKSIKNDTENYKLIK